jgi:GT2 family glycosyltransferase
LKIVCIIVTYNGKIWIDKCLKSLYRSTRPTEIFIVDNNSQDGTTGYLKDNYPEVTLIESAANLGFGQANNIGFKKAIAINADFVLLLNQDAWVGENSIERLIDVAFENPEFSILSPFHYNYEGTEIEKYFNDFIIGHFSPNYINDLHFNKLKRVYPADFIHAACWLIPVSTLREVGGFDPLFFHYGEDNDYVQRLLSKKLKIGFVPDAVIFHYGTNQEMTNPGKNFFFNVNQSVLQLKKPDASVAGALLVFLKSAFDGMTSAIIYRNFRRFVTEVKVFWFNLKRIKRIIASRKLQNQRAAYLDVEA